MISAKGLLIAVEGVDGAGKYTQVRALRLALEKLGYTVSEYSFPDYTGSRLGVTLKEMLSGRFGNATFIHPSLSAPLFALERAEKRERILADLASGKLVLCDRYVYSNVAHQACRLPDVERGEFQRWLETIEFEILGLPRPHLTVLLDVDNQVASDRRRIRSQESGQERPLDDYEKDEGSISLARTIYLSLARELQWIVVPTGAEGRSFEREAITLDVLRNIKPRLPSAT
jgi:dTMP kinase